MLRYVAGLAAVGLLAVGGAARADYEAGKNALEAGRPAEALSEWRAAASSGDRRAMLALGRLFLKGVGAPQDYVLAHMWLNLAASRGDAEAAKERNALSARMTPQQIAAAQDRARSWRPEPGSVFRDCPQCPEMVVVPAGSFTMGSPSSEKGRQDDEGPVRRVRIENAFAVGKYEVRRWEYGRFVSETGHVSGDACWVWGGEKWEERSGYSWKNPGFDQSDDHPVACVNWGDAQSYIRWLSGKAGKEYRLLSESEWEYAARAGTTGPFHTGVTISTDQANYNGNYVYGNGRKGVYREKTVPVGSFGGNGFGLHDMHGNVWEWVEDCWKGSYAGAPSDGSAWESGDCGGRILRGGFWGLKPGHLRSANRSGSDAGNRFNHGGFRVARTLAR